MRDKIEYLINTWYIKQQITPWYECSLYDIDKRFVAIWWGKNRTSTTVITNRYILERLNKIYLSVKYNNDKVVW